MNDDRALLLHRLDAADCIAEDVAEGEDAFFASRRLRDAILRQLQVLGEATKRLSPGLRAAHPEVEWRKVAGMRDWIVHHYFGINKQLVWKTASVSVLILRAEVARILVESWPQP